MFIKYNEYDMLELFNSEPISIGSIETGELIYSYRANNDFSVTLFMNVYAQLVNLTLCYKENIVFTCNLKEVKSISKVDKYLLIDSSNKQIIKLKFHPQIGVEFLED